MTKDQFFNLQNFYLVGIKGVAMTSIAQCLLDAKKYISGTDVKQNFVTKKILDNLNIQIQTNFKHDLPEKTDCVIYTAAHDGIDNFLVQQAIKKNIPAISQAEALSYFFNNKKGLAVCGVGGKSTVSAMLAWTLIKLNQNPSYSIGVGNIPKLNKTGNFNNESEFFIAEADEYVIDPKAPDKKEPIKPRFSFLKPYLTICTNLKFDHPDVYKNFEHTQQIFLNFFAKTKSYLVVNADNKILVELTKNLNKKIISFGESAKSDFRLIKYKSLAGQTNSEFIFQNSVYKLKLTVPGKFNVFNSLTCIAACVSLGFEIKDCVKALEDFPSTQRRFELVKEKNDIKFYDDYAHHPSEVKAAIQALNEWYPNNKKIIAFQPHTYSRTKALFDDFITAFADADEVLLLDIFSSAREAADENVTSDKLAQAIKQQYPDKKISNLKNIDNLAKFFSNLEKNSVAITLGAGDIYEVYDNISI
jgi:UDP-N-acetylmuramate--alanine ligase